MTDPETYDEWLARTEPSPEFRRRLAAKSRAQGLVMLVLFMVFVLSGETEPIALGALVVVVAVAVVRDVLLYRGAPITDARIVALAAFLFAAALVAAVVLVPWPFNLIAVVAALLADGTVALTDHTVAVMVAR